MTAQRSIQSIYAGPIYLGILLSRSKLGTEALDASKKSLGVYADKQSAIDAVFQAAGDALNKQLDFAAVSRQGARRRRAEIRRTHAEQEGNLKMGELVKADDIERLQDEVEDLRGDGIGTLMKFDHKKERFFIGEDEVPLGREYIAHCDQYARGWTKFVDKQRVDQKIFKVREGKPPERENLDDLEHSGAEDDSWVFQRFLPLEDVETGEIVIFVSKSYGGKIALGDLLAVYADTWDRGLPIVKLATTKFKSKKYGLTPRPSFAIVRRDGKPVKTVASTADDVRADDSGPPERDPDDPGYDLLYPPR